MRFLVFNDPHIRGNAPINRKDNFVETQKTKFREVIQIAQDFKTDYLLCGGDMYDAPVPSMSVAGEIMEILLSAGIPIFTVAGNHDFYAANTVTLARTLLGYTAKLQGITLLDREPVFFTKDGVTVQLTGQPYHCDIDKEGRDPQLDYCIKKSPDCDAAIHIVHGMLMENGDFPGDLTLLDDITETEADITISGHNHIGWGVRIINGKYFVNPGGLVRLSNHKNEITRQVGVTLIEIEKGYVSCEFKALESALPGEEVLDRTKVEEMVAMEKKLAVFTQELKNTNDMNRANVDTIIRQAVKDSVDTLETDIVLKEALRRIAIAEESLVQKGKVA